MKRQATNPYMGSAEHVPDGEPHVFGDRVYVYGSHDRFGGDDFCLLNYVCWSAPVDDLSDWRYEGFIYDKEKDPLYKEGNRLFAPDITIGPDGRYYLYYGFDHTGYLAVAVCDQPAGDFEFYGHICWPDGTLLGDKPEDMFQYDPAILVDDDGRVFLYSGFCPDVRKVKKFAHLKPNDLGGMVIELESDMKTVKRAPEFIAPTDRNSAGTGYEGHAFFEASSIRKYNGKYYFLYSSENGHELCYAMSDRPDGDFKYCGTIISNGDIFYQGNTKSLNYTGTNHGGLVQIGEKYYIFWHRQSGGSAYARQGCADEVFMDEEGKIAQVPMTSCGLNGGPLSGKKRYQAGIACCLMSGQGACPYAPKTRIGAEHPYFTHDGGDWDPASRIPAPEQYITNMKDGACCGFRYFDLSATTEISAEYRLTQGTEEAEGKLLITDGLAGNLLAEIPVSVSKAAAPGESKASSQSTCKASPQSTCKASSHSSSAKWLSSKACLDIAACRNPGKSELWITYQGSGAIDLLAVRLE